MRKSFKEVFSQRGKEVSGEDLISGACYLFSKGDEESAGDWVIIHKHKVTETDVFGVKFYCEAQLFDDGDVFHRGFVRRSEFGKIYEATEDQIALLKKY